MLHFFSKYWIWIILGATTVAAAPGVPVIFQGSNVAQFLPTITEALLGNGYALVPSKAFFGDGSDGNVTVSTPIVLTRDQFYNNLTIAVGGSISFQNQRVFVAGTLDLTNAAAFTLDGSGTSGNNGGAGGAGGGAGATTAVGTNITGRSGGAGGAGGTTTGTQGAAGAGGNSITGSGGGSGGAGGTGTSGAGGAQRNSTAVTNYPMRDITTWFTPQSGNGGQVFVGGAGSGGGGGGGDGANSGGGGGGGGSSGQTVYIAANIITTGVSTPGGVITSWGGAGGNGGSPAAGNTGGGGAGGPGSGGWVVVKYNTKIGAAVTGLIGAIPNVFSGTPGTGHGTGTNGSAGDTTAAGNGLIQILDLKTGTITTSTSGTANL